MKINLYQRGLIAAVVLFGQTNLWGQASTGWTGASDGLWNNVGNWTNGVPNSSTNSSGQATRILNFGSGGNARPNSTNDMNNLSGHRIFFNAGATNYTLFLKSGTVGTTLNDFSQNQPQIQNDSTNLQTVDMSFKMQAKGITIAANQAANINPTAGDLVFTTNCTITLITNTQFRFFSTAGRSVTFYGPVVQSAGVSNGCALMTTSSGGVGATVIFYNTNSCTNTIINCGTIRLATNNVTVNPIVLGDTTSVVAPSANLQLDNGFSSGSPIIVQLLQPSPTNFRTVGNTAFGSGTADFTGAITLGTNLITLANAAGTLEFDGNIDFQNPSGGSLRQLTVSGAGNTMITGSLTNAATGSSVLLKTNSGILTLLGTNNANRILFNLGGGILSITNAGAIGVPTGVTYPDKLNFTGNATLSVTNSFTLGRNAGGADNAGFRINGGSTGTFDVASGSTLTLDGSVIDIAATGAGSLAKINNGTLVLQQTNTYSGNTSISAGTLALTGAGSLANTPNIIVAGGAVFDVSGLSPAFVLGSGQTLSNNTSSATVSGTASTASGTVSLIYLSGTPALSVGNGTLTLSAGTTFKINHPGAALPAGSYKIVATNSAGSVAGILPAVTVNEGGLAPGTSPSLTVSNSELYLVVMSNTTTALTLLIGASPSTYGDGLTLQAVVNPAPPDGETVTFKDGALTIGTGTTTSGAATLAISTLAAGAHSLTAVYPGDTDHLLGSTSSTLSQTVNTASLGITANNASKVYDGAAFSGGDGVIYTGFVNGETSAELSGALSYGGTSQGATNAGSYTIVPSGQTSANYAIHYTNGTFTVIHAVLAVTASSMNKVYGQAVSFAGTEFTTSGLTNGDTVTSVTLTSGGATNTASVGSYPVNASAATGSGLGNYDISYVDGSLAVNPAMLGVTADNQSRAYGATNPVLTASFSGFVNGESLTNSDVAGAPDLGTSADTNSPSGAYDITNSVGSLTSTNYVFNLTNGTLTINPAGLTISANDAGKVFDGLGYSGGNGVIYTGFVNGETSAELSGALSYGGTSQGATNAGNYTIVPFGLTATNYAISYTNGILTVTTLGVTVTANAQTKIYGAADPALSFQSSPALITGDSFNGALTRVAGEEVGSYAIGQGTLALSSNYQLAYVGTNLTITPATLSVTANDTNKAYGQTLTFAGTEFTASGLANGDSVTSVTLTSSGAGAGAAAGIYSVVPSAAAGSGLDNYNINYNNGNLTVTTATPVTINRPVVLIDRNIQLTFTGGDPGVSYRIQASTDLSNPAWCILTTNVATMTGLPSFIDLDATNHPIRFYRTVIP